MPLCAKSLDKTKKSVCIPLNSLDQTISYHRFHADLPQLRGKQDPDKEHSVLQ